MPNFKPRPVCVTSVLEMWRNLCLAGPGHRTDTVHSLSRCVEKVTPALFLKPAVTDFCKKNNNNNSVSAAWIFILVMCCVSIPQDLVEKVVVLRRAVEQTQRSGPTAIGILLAEKMSQYANLLASQGSLSTAITYLPDNTNQVCNTSGLGCTSYL